MDFDDGKLCPVSNGPLFLGNEFGSVLELPSRHRHAPPVTLTLDPVHLIETEIRIGHVSRLAGGGLGKPIRDASFYVDRIGAALCGGPDLGLATALLAFDGPPVVVAKNANCDRSAGVLGVDHDRLVGVVAKDEVWCCPTDRGLDPLGITGEVERVRAVGHVLIATPEDGVVSGGGELADTTTDRVLELPGDDCPRRHIPLRRRSLADVLVEVEFGSGPDDDHVHCVGHQVDIVHPVLAARVVCGE